MTLSIQALMSMERAATRAATRTAGRLAAAAVAAGLLAGCVVAPVAPYRGAYRAAPPPAAQTPMYFYPERGQGAERQDRDRYECYRWAVRETGFEPGMTPTTGARRVSVAPPPPGGAEVGAGAAAGAVVGAVASPGRAGEGAVIGAIFGSLLGAVAQESRQQAYEAAAARDAAEQARARAPMDYFRRAMSACMGGRGYRVE